MKNLFAGIAATLPEELVEVLVQTDGVRLERIVSTGHATPPGEWYDQAMNEWVLVVRGGARLRFEGDESVVVMGPGDHVVIPANCRHRVEWTVPNEPTIWLALHYPTPTGKTVP
jgi:cupin 2 domain-containing protein